MRVKILTLITIAAFLFSGITSSFADDKTPIKKTKTEQKVEKGTITKMEKNKKDCNKECEHKCCGKKESKENKEEEK